MHSEDGFDDLLVLRADEHLGYLCFLFRSLRELLWVNKHIDVSSYGTVHLYQFGSAELAQEIQLVRDQFPDAFAHSREKLFVPSSDDTGALNKMIASMNERVRTKSCYWSAFDASTRKETWNINPLTPSDTPVVLMRPECVSWLVPNGDWESFRSMVSQPEHFGGERIGEGSEAVVYRVMWNGRLCAVKTVNEDAVNEFRILSEQKLWGRMTPHYSRPQFLKRAGFMEMVMDVISHVPDLSIELEGVQTFAVGHEFEVVEYVPAAMAMSDLAPKKDDPDPQARAFLEAHGITPHHLEVAKNTLKEVEKWVAFVRSGRFFCGSRLQFDTHPNNILVCGLNPTTQQLRLRLIDQGSDPPAYDVSMMMFDDMEADDVFQSHRKIYEELRRDPNHRYKAFLKRYFPKGFPKKRTNP